MSEAVVAADVSPSDDEAESSEERVAELVSSLSVEDLEPVIAEAGPEKLAAIKAAEEAGKERKGVLEAVASREEELDSGADNVVEIDEEPSWVDAPVDQLIPFIGVGWWVRFAAARGIPKHAVGRDGVVVQAPSSRSQGGDTMSDRAYDYQDGTEVFTVRLRDTSELIQCTRAAFASFDSDQVRLSAA